jgi:hypothetical protein
MAAGKGFSRVLKDRRWEDYKSLKQAWQHRPTTEFLISGYQTTTAAAAELNFQTGDTINYIGTAAQAYIRCEADDANQDNKYVYIRYCDDSGTISAWSTADISDAPDSTTEVAIGGTDFYRLREMYSQVESASGGGKCVLLTDSNMGGADDIFGFIDDGESVAAINRYFVPSAATCTSYLGRIVCRVPYLLEGDATPGGYFLTITFTPVALNGGEVGAAADITQVLSFNEVLDWQPCIELQPATDVIIKIHKLVDADHVGMHIEASFLEVTPSTTTT